MGKCKFTPEQVIRELREAEVLINQDMDTPEAARQIGISRQTYYRWRKEYGSKQIDRWRQEYNYIRPHSSLGYRPPAPDAIFMGGINEQLGENVDLKGILNANFVT